MNRVAVIGAGPSGMMAAYQAALRGLDVTVYDGNEKQGRKLRITGKGRCNICNDCDINTVLGNIPGDGRFLYSSLNAFSPADVISFFESNGLILKTERGNRVFPESDNANDVADLMVHLCESAGVKFIRKVVKDINSLEYDALIVATGGMSYPLTGSTGFGYRIAESFGHNVVSPVPSLIPLESDDWFCPELAGFSPRNVILRAYEGGKLIYKELGEMLFTHFGISGPLVLSSSSHMKNFADCRVEIDFKPALDDNKLDERILRDFKDFANKTFANYLPKLVGKSMAEVVISLSGISGDTRINEVTHEQRVRLRSLLKAFPVNITGSRPIDEAIVTKGGVDVREINPRTMESKLQKGLYFCGEVLNLDAYTGGFNLQIAWSTGYVAGREVLNDK